MFIHIQVEEESNLPALLRAITESGGTVVSAGVDVGADGVDVSVEGVADAERSNSLGARVDRVASLAQELQMLASEYSSKQHVVSRELHAAIQREAEGLQDVDVCLKHLASCVLAAGRTEGANALLDAASTLRLALSKTITLGL